jgi:hypothetical protein
MASKKIFENDIGVQFRVYAGVDISSATSIVMKVKKPSGTETSWTASYDTDNSYYATYTTVSGDLNEDGDWLLSLEVQMPTAPSITGESASFTVYEQFEDT